MFLILLVLNLIYYSYSDEVKITIDEVELQSEWKKTLSYDGFATYYYHENELVRVNCSWSNTGDMKIELRDEKKLNWFKKTNEITFMIKLRTETDEQYVDCCHIDAKKTIFRIRFKPKPVAEYSDPWMIKINEMEWNPRPNRIDYKYVLGEELYASCLNTSYVSEMTLMTDGYSHFKVNTTEYNHTLNCSKAGNNSTQMFFHLLDTERIGGLRSSKILFWFSDPKNILIIHYEYEENDHLDLSWSVKPLKNHQNNYSVYIKDKSQREVEVLIANGKYINLNIPTITLRREDDGSTIRFWRSTIEDVKLSPHKEIWIIPRLKSVLPSEQFKKKQRHKKSKLGFYGAIASGVFTLILILMLVLYLITRRKQIIPKDESPDHNYGNLTNEETTIPPFPSQWDTYANMQVDLNNDVQDLYAKPLPKSLRKGKIPDNSKVDVSETDLYSEIRDRVSFKEDSTGYAHVR